MYIDSDDLDLAFFIAENKLLVATSFKILSDALLIR